MKKSVKKPIAKKPAPAKMPPDLGSMMPGMPMTPPAEMPMMKTPKKKK